MDNNEFYLVLGFVISSKYRTKVLKSIGENIMMPTEIAKDTDLRINHVSNVLRDLKDKGLVVCLNENTRKGRLYKITDFGLEILELL